MTFKIEKKAMPNSKKNSNTGLSETLRTMRIYDEENGINDSIVLDLIQVQSLARIAKDAGIKVTRLKEGDKFRVWRIG